MKQKSEMNILAAVPGRTYELVMYYEGRERHFNGEKSIDLSPIEIMIDKGLIIGYQVKQHEGGRETIVLSRCVPQP